LTSTGANITLPYLTVLYGCSGIISGNPYLYFTSGASNYIMCCSIGSNGLPTYLGAVNSAFATTDVVYLSKNGKYLLNGESGTGVAVYIINPLIPQTPSYSYTFTSSTTGIKFMS
jgi:hypothetical protein